ncbi:MAG: hypothetical protein R3240_05645, partial [Gammaproteobacteria bacterium]|nr:hypothetical protein [Gammaproteobacteria bacterium]
MSSLNWTEAGTATQAPNIRIVMLDLLRGFAVLGIYWINIAVFTEDINSFFEAVQSELAFSLEWVSGSFTDDIIEGTMRGLFSILFGASAMVFLNEAKLASQGLEVVDRYYRRTLLLVLFGLIHAYFFLWPYDVLYVYGIFGMFLFPLRKISANFLLIFGIILLFIGDISTGAPEETVKTANSETSEAELNQVIADTDREISLKTLDTGSERTLLIEPESKSQPPTIPGYILLFKRNIEDVVDKQSTKMY